MAHFFLTEKIYCTFLKNVSVCKCMYLPMHVCASFYLPIIHKFCNGVVLCVCPSLFQHPVGLVKSVHAPKGFFLNKRMVYLDINPFLQLHFWIYWTGGFWSVSICSFYRTVSYYIYRKCGLILRLITFIVMPFMFYRFLFYINKCMQDFWTILCFIP